MNIEVTPKSELFKDLKAGDVFKIIIDGEGTTYCIKTSTIEDYEEGTLNAIDLDNGTPQNIGDFCKVTPLRARLVVEE